MVAIKSHLGNKTLQGPRSEPTYAIMVSHLPPAGCHVLGAHRAPSPGDRLWTPQDVLLDGFCSVWPQTTLGFGRHRHHSDTAVGGWRARNPRTKVSKCDYTTTPWGRLLCGNMFFPLTHHRLLSLTSQFHISSQACAAAYISSATLASSGIFFAWT